MNMESLEKLFEKVFIFQVMTSSIMCRYICFLSRYLLLITLPYVSRSGQKGSLPESEGRGKKKRGKEIDTEWARKKRPIIRTRVEEEVRGGI